MMMTKKTMFAAVLSACALTSIAADYPCVGGVYPHLATFNREGECGTGAVVPWAGKLWAISYAPHMPNRSTDKLYEISPDLSRVIRKESIGGTPANRLIHKESNQLFIGPYAIDGKGNVRVMEPINADGSTNLYGRLTASARHLKDPAHKIYTMTMEEGVYEIDVDTLKVTELFKDGNIQGYGKHDGTLLPGYHGKGGYSGQGRLVYANNGEFSPAAMKDPTTPSGVLAQWNGEPGTNNWKVVLRNQFTDITSVGGIFGATNPDKDPLWAIGWDYRSVMLMVLENGEWHKYRLPKGSHSYDGAHGWNTEWPRIREIGEGLDFLMTMHGTFWHFPATMSVGNSAGIKPRSNYLKIVGDFCRWGDKVVLGCDDTAANEFLNKRSAKGAIGGPGQSNSSLWFLDPSDFDTFGPVIGRGSVWQNEAVKKGIPSDPYILDGYDCKTLYLSGDPCAFAIEIDEKGNGEWKRVPGCIATKCAKCTVKIDLNKFKGAWLRLVPLQNAKNVIAFFNYVNVDKRGAADAKFDGVAADKSKALFATISSNGEKQADEDKLTPEQICDRLTLDYVTADGKLYRMDKTLKFSPSEDKAALERMTKLFRIDTGKGDEYDAASAVITDDDGKRWRFPYAKEGDGVPAFKSRLCREVCTERDLLNLAGTFYELPAENAGGYSKIRPVATHDRAVYDYCTWRGLFFITGVDTSVENKAGRIIKSDDGKAAVWVGVADDLWAFGKPHGVGGPWKDTAVAADAVSDPYLMCGYDVKELTLRQTGAAKAKVTLELDVTGSGDWKSFRTYELEDGKEVKDDLTAVRAYWLRFRTDTACTATTRLVYR